MAHGLHVEHTSGDQFDKLIIIIIAQPYLLKAGNRVITFFEIFRQSLRGERKQCRKKSFYPNHGQLLFKFYKKYLIAMYIFFKNAFLIPNFNNYLDLRTFVAKISWRHFRTFSAKVFGLRSGHAFFSAFRRCRSTGALYAVVYYYYISCSRQPCWDIEGPFWFLVGGGSDISPDMIFVNKFTQPQFLAQQIYAKKA